jgi:hypothetical protein
MKRHPALIPLSRDHHGGLVQALRLRRAAATRDASARLAAAGDFVEFFRNEERVHLREEEEEQEELFPLYEIRGMTFRDGLDVRSFVTEGHYEALDVRCNPVILGQGELDSFDATFRCALTVEGQRLVDTVFLRPFRDPLIDRAKHLFVACRSIRKVHRNIFPDLPRGARSNPRQAKAADG